MTLIDLLTLILIIIFAPAAIAIVFYEIVIVYYVIAIVFALIEKAIAHIIRLVKKNDDDEQE